MTVQPTFATGVAAMLLSNVFFSLMAVLLRVDPGLSGWEAAFYRFAIGGMFVVTLAFFGRTTLRFHDKKGLFWRGILGGISVVMYYLPVNEIGLARTSLFQYAYPFYAIVFSALFLGEKVTLREGLLLLLAIGGLVVLEWPALETGSWNPWVVCAWASGVLSGLAVMFVKKLSATESSTAIFLAQCLGGFWIILLPGHMVDSPPGWLPAVILLVMGLSAAVAQLLMTWSYKAVDVSTGSLLGTLVPVMNIAAGVWWFGESFEPLELVGAGATLSACVLLVLVKMKRA